MHRTNWTQILRFFYYAWNKTLTVDQCITGFHSRIYKIAPLQLCNNQTYHLLLRQAALPSNEKNMIYGVPSDSYDVFISQAPYEMHTYMPHQRTSPWPHRATIQSTHIAIKIPQ